MSTSMIPVEHKAGFGERLVAAIIDGVMLAVLGFIIGMFLRGPAGNGLGLVIAAGYYTYFEGSASGQSIGKKMMNIRVLDVVTGQSPEYSKAFIRYIVSIASGIACLVGYLWMLWDKDKDTWHDKVSGTACVNTSYYPVEAWPG